MVVQAGIRDGSKISIAETTAYREHQAQAQAAQQQEVLTQQQQAQAVQQVHTLNLEAVTTSCRQKVLLHLFLLLA